ncbi:MAG: M20/M25/M40 family metallo-hydrolase, partial [Flavisolibacter sp.]
MINTPIHTIQEQAVNLLKNLISTPSISREEEFTATLLQHFFEENNIRVQRHLNNVWVRNKYYNEKKPTLLLNSHHDTVRPNKGYTRDPYLASVEEGKLFGLGSNDAGGALVSLIAAFLNFYDEQDLQYNLLLAATAEEEISGRNGIEALLPLMGKIDCGIVGEPTKMEMAIAERGLIVLDCVA